MAEEFDHDQRELAQLWKRARKDGCMPPWQQAKVFGLKEAWEEMHGDKTYGQLKWIAERVYVQWHPKRHPSHEAVRHLFGAVWCHGEEGSILRKAATNIYEDVNEFGEVDDSSRDVRA